MGNLEVNTEQYLMLQLVDVWKMSFFKETVLYDLKF